MKLFIFDLETTGILPYKHGIHQISGQIVVDGQLVESFDFHVCPNERAQIDPQALQVAGVTEEQIKQYPSMSTVFNSLILLLSKYVDRYDSKDKFFLVGYNNASFDNDFLRGFFKQNNDLYFGSWFWPNSLDVMILATMHLMPLRPTMKDFKLATVAATLGVEVEPDALHNASYDVALTRAIYDKVVGIY